MNASLQSPRTRGLHKRETLRLNVAATCLGTYALGPGYRAAVWVQGCPFHCAGCISPEWIPDLPARLVSPEELLDELLENPQVTGLTFSGGEPMHQAQGLAELSRLAKRRRDVDLICFSGYTLDRLRANPPAPGVDLLLAQLDVLVDGPYIASLNDNKGLRGSQNQQIHYLTPRLSMSLLEETPRRAEVHVQNGQAFLVGVPPQGMGAAFSSAIHKFRSQRYRLVQNERA